MKSLKVFSGALAVAGTVFQAVSGQGTIGTYTDPATGIVFQTNTIPDGSPNSGLSTGGYTVGLALPANAATVDTKEYLGIIIGSSTSATATGWAGFSHGGGMTNNLLLMAWPNNGKILTSFRSATGYVDPSIYTGNAKLTQISSSINSTHYTLIYRCQNCLAIDLGGATDTSHSTQGVLVIAWAQALPAPLTPSDPNSDIVQHDNGMGIFGFPVAGAVQAKYANWIAALPVETGTPTSVAPTSTATPTTTTTKFPYIPVPTGTWDYIVAGGGAGGIPVAANVAATGKKTLLIERGPPSLARWGGTLGPDWVRAANLTRFDVPGLCNEIWVDSKGIACNDISLMSGCVLGGGTAINAALWWKPNPVDWDYNFPVGWKSNDMVAATNKVFGKIPGTDHPSMDGKLYLQEGFDVLASGLAHGGWKSVVPNTVPGQKNRTYGHTPYMYKNAQRDGPMATYLVEAAARKNFGLWTHTSVKRLIRTGGHITAVEVEPYAQGGYTGIVNLTAVTGRVILSAGAFGSTKILFRSGIGPKDQLEIVAASTDGPTMINRTQWINLPVGQNLDDHTNTDLVVSHPDVVFYDFYEAWNTPNETDKAAYLNSRSGILAQSAPNIGPMFWEVISGLPDKIDRQLQWTARVEGSAGAPNGNTMTLSQYLGRGAQSRGKAAITSDLNMIVATPPYLHDANDVRAVVKGIESVQAALNTVANLTFVVPPPGTNITEWVASLPAVTSTRTANHWIGTSKLGLDDGRTGGSAVVDLNTQVYGTDNLFVVDASIFPGHVTTNPSALIVTASEHASGKILALPCAQALGKNAQCGGVGWKGSFVCKTGLSCKSVNAGLSTCQ